jgi:acetylornithine deacetylase/succinyl-diaminopimelate desuccinylase-like protein
MLSPALLLLTLDPAALAQTPPVQKALQYAKSIEPEIIAEQRRVCEIAAPTGQEEKRGLEFQRIFASLGLKNIRIDAVGNVIGERPGKAARPNAVIAAHLDTVFPEFVGLKTKMEGSIIHGPGIGDDCRGLAVLIGIVRSLDHAKIETAGTLTFVANVGEEGLGDLKGVKNLFNVSMKDKIDSFISIDGTGLRITRIGVGSYRYRLAYKGKGGHSFGAFGSANPVHAMGRAIAKIGDFEVPDHPKTTFNVGRVGGGTSVNSIAFESWAEVDMRSSDAKSLNSLDEKFKTAAVQALNEENARWKNKGKIDVEIKMLGNRPAGETAENAPILKTALAVSKALGFAAETTTGEGSTDSNYPMSLHIPALTIGGGGRGEAAHSPEESFDITDSWKGTQRAILLALALAN